MPIDEEDKFEKISDEVISQISGGNSAMIYKRGLFSKWLVWTPDGRLKGQCWTKGGAFDLGKKLSRNSPGSCAGAVRELTEEEYKMLLKQERIQEPL